MFPDFLRTIIKHWVNWMSGLVGVLLWIGGFIANMQGWPEWSKLSFWAGGSVALLFSFYSVWREERVRVVALEKRVKGLPKLKLAESGFHRDAFSRFTDPPNQETYSCLRLRIVNDPDESTPESVAKGIRADISFFGEDDARLLLIDGRWSDSAQPHAQKPELGIVPYLTAEFPIGQSRNLDLVAKRFGERCCFAVNNDSFRFAHMQNPDFRLPPGITKCRVRLRGEY